MEKLTVDADQLVGVEVVVDVVTILGVVVDSDAIPILVTYIA